MEYVWYFIKYQLKGLHALRWNAVYIIQEYVNFEIDDKWNGVRPRRVSL